MESEATGVNGGKTQVVLLTGFLGAGKTTLLKHILGWETDLSDTVVIVNEFGEVGIDGKLLENGHSDVVELTSGCICCTLVYDLQKSLMRIWENYRPRRLFIESSGVADPIAVVEALEAPPLEERLVLETIVTVVDVDFWEDREIFGRLFYHQLEVGNLILLNKVDLLDRRQVDVFLKELHETIPDSRVVPTIQCRIDPEILWSNSRAKGQGPKPVGFSNLLEEIGDSPADAVNAVHGNFTTFCFEEHRPLNEERFKRFVSALPFSLFRMKGAVRFEDRTLLVNHVGGKNDFAPWEGEEGTRLAFVGWDVEAAGLLAQLRACIA